MHFSFEIIPLKFKGTGNLYVGGVIKAADESASDC
jgi:hypothetical protein